MSTILRLLTVAAVLLAAIHAQAAPDPRALSIARQAQILVLTSSETFVGMVVGPVEAVTLCSVLKDEKGDLEDVRLLRMPEGEASSILDRLDAEVVVQDETRNLCLIYSTGIIGMTPVPLGTTRGLSLNAPAYLTPDSLNDVGRSLKTYFNAFRLRFEHGQIKKLFRCDEYDPAACKGDDASLLGVFAPYSGVPGGGVFDRQGRLLGITYGMFADRDGILPALPVEWVAKLLEDFDQRDRMIAREIRARVEARDLVFATTLVEQLSDPSRQVYWYTRIAILRAPKGTMGDTSSRRLGAALNALRLADVAASKLNGRHQDHAFERIVRAQTKIGIPGTAWNTLDRIRPGRHFDRAASTVAKSFARIGWFKHAGLVASRIEDQARKTKTLAYIARKEESRTWKGDKP